MKRILCILDPLEKLNPLVDSTLHVLRLLETRGHKIWACDVPQVVFERQQIDVLAGRLTCLPGHRYRLGKPVRLPAASFDLIWIRKEPPFNANYYYLTYLLEYAAKAVPVSNDPRGIRNANEKLSSLFFSHWMPESMVSLDPGAIQDFRRRLKCDLVLKPLDQKGGKGIVLIKQKDPQGGAKIRRATQDGHQCIMAQRFLQATPAHGEKRIFLLNGKRFVSYGKKARKGEFRANLGFGSHYQRGKLSPREEKMIRELGPYLRREGILLAALDVLEERLIEINVTCPGGLPEAEELYPEIKPLTQLAQALEALWEKPRRRLPPDQKP